MQQGFWLYLLRKGVEDSPEEFLGEKELLLRGYPEAAHTRRQAIVLPVLLVVVGQQLQGHKKMEAFELNLFNITPLQWGENK